MLSGLPTKHMHKSCTFNITGSYLLTYKLLPSRCFRCRNIVEEHWTDLIYLFFNLWRIFVWVFLSRASQHYSFKSCEDTSFNIINSEFDWQVGAFEVFRASHLIKSYLCHSTKIWISRIVKFWFYVFNINFLSNSWLLSRMVEYWTDFNYTDSTRYGINFL